MDRVALFDFCGTIADFQTFNPFIELVLKKEKPERYRFYKNKFVTETVKIITKMINMFAHDYYFDKHLLVALTKGIHEKAFIDQAYIYYNNIVTTRLISKSLEILALCKGQGIYTIILSAGCDQYINLFAEKYGVDSIIASKLCFVHGVSVGRFEDKDINGKVKIEALKYFMNERGMDPNYILGVSDSASDKSVLDLCKRKIVISKGKHQSWVNDNYQEVIYDEEHQTINKKGV